MGLTSRLNRTYGTVLLLAHLCAAVSLTENISAVAWCSDYGDIEFATVKPMDIGTYNMYAIHIECNVGYELVGHHKLLCKDGKWDPVPRPQCVPQCEAPPPVANGRVYMEGAQDKAGWYNKGTLATYVCNIGYQIAPPESKYRVCEKGIWTGALAACMPYEQLTNCRKPKDIANGYFVQEKNGIVNRFLIGQRLHYSCNTGYLLDGPPVQQCLEDGSWSPRIPPSCVLDIPDSNTEAELDYPPCPALPVVPHAHMVVLRGHHNDLRATAGTEIEYRCDRGYRNTFTSPCQHVLLTCNEGVWHNQLPNCVPVKQCLPPPNVANARMLEIPTQTSGRVPLYQIGAEVLYKCLPGYKMSGNYLLTCSARGCWEPLLHYPTCQPDEQFLDEYMNTSGTLLVSITTASGVMLILLGVCLVIVCRHRKPWGRQPLGQVVRVAVPHPNVSPGDSTSTLLHDPDRLALIAFADGLQASQQSGLPSYEEAVRERTTTGAANGVGSASFLGHRPHRPNWSALGASRRNRPLATGQQSVAHDPHVTRQSSCTSHTASMRSCSVGDPMGSTDTMTPSEVSTNITLDTVSSHSGSQPASCRAICGSLASFDTSSILNTDGVPLLEENESDEAPNTETAPNGLDHRSIVDNLSFKFRRTSPDLV